LKSLLANAKPGGSIELALSVREQSVVFPVRGDWRVAASENELSSSSVGWLLMLAEAQAVRYVDEIGTVYEYRFPQGSTEPQNKGALNG